jgi:hypothetical protein
LTGQADGMLFPQLRQCFSLAASKAKSTKIEESICRIYEANMSKKEKIIDKIFYYVDSVMFIFFCLVAILISCSIFIKIKVDGELSVFLVYIIAPLSFIFGIYGIYRVFQQKKFLKIFTGLSKVNNKIIVLDFLKHRNYTIKRQTVYSVYIIEEATLSINNMWTTHIDFKIEENYILFNMQNHYPRINPPVFFGHLFLKSDIKSFIAEKKGLIG